MLMRLERLLSNFSAGRDDGIGRLALEARARIVARHVAQHPMLERDLSDAEREVLEAARRIAILSWRPTEGACSEIENRSADQGVKS